VRIRRAALDVLTLLRELEESTGLPLWDNANDEGSNRSSGAHHVADGAFGCVNGRVILGVGQGGRAQHQQGDQAAAAGAVGRTARTSSQYLNCCSPQTFKLLSLQDDHHEEVFGTL
jgi:hypothetical protein